MIFSSKKPSKWILVQSGRWTFTKCRWQEAQLNLLLGSPSYFGLRCFKLCRQHVVAWPSEELGKRTWCAGDHFGILSLCPSWVEVVCLSMPQILGPICFGLEAVTAEVYRRNTQHSLYFDRIESCGRWVSWGNGICCVPFFRGESVFFRCGLLEIRRSGCGETYVNWGHFCNINWTTIPANKWGPTVRMEDGSCCGLDGWNFRMFNEGGVFYPLIFLRPQENETFFSKSIPFWLIHHCVGISFETQSWYVEFELQLRVMCFMGFGFWHPTVGNEHAARSWNFCSGL